MPNIVEKIAEKFRPKQPNKNVSAPPSIQAAICPICLSVTSYMYFMTRGDTEERSDWYKCKCGVIWQAKPPRAFKKDASKSIYNEEYLEEYLANGDKHIASATYPCRVYAQFIEDLMYGRKMLDVGFNTRFNMGAFQERGWVVFGNDINDYNKPDSRTFVGDFETLEIPEDLKFNLIWMSHTLEHFKNPLAVLKKCHNLLVEDGVMFIATPDTDFVFTRSSSGYCHFTRDEHYIMWNMTSLCKELERLGFNILLKRRNYEQRYVSWDDLHIICQKSFF